MLSLAQLRKGSTGFSMVELMVTLSVIAILAALATPTLRSAMVNGRIRAAGQAMQSGLAMARAEGVRLNTQVQFVLVSTGWEIRRLDTGAVLQQATGKESGRDLTVTVTPTGADRITYNAFGQAASVNPTGTARITQVDIEIASPPDGYKPLRIEVSGSGVTRLCDPLPGAPEYRACRT
jgi:type IV fimbrial biogenesis protein FimT